MRTLIKGGTVVTATETTTADVVIEDEKVAAIGLGMSVEADRVIDIMLKQDSKLKGRESLALSGAVAMMATVEGLKRAGKNLTRDGFIEAMESMKDWTPEKLTAPITWGPNRRHGLNPIRMMQGKKAADASFTVITGYQPFPPQF